MSANPILGSLAPTPERLQGLEARAFKPASQEFALPPELELAQKKRDAYNQLMTTNVTKQLSQRVLDDIAKGRLPIVQDVLVSRFGFQ